MHLFLSDWILEPHSLRAACVQAPAAAVLQLLPLKQVQVRMCIVLPNQRRSYTHSAISGWKTSASDSCGYKYSPRLLFMREQTTSAACKLYPSRAGYAI